MSSTEKITINMSVVDLGKVDLLVHEGFYSNRTDFIRSSIRNQLVRHEGETHQIVERNSVGVGVFRCSKQSLERALAEGNRINYKIAGMLVFDQDISPKLANDTIGSITVWGVIRASHDIKQALGDRIQ